ncbi:hypothetical protein [Moraxella caprae]|uniref:hypothetical protein n=1 Tax=Moraxella caprae TaxID=90240 RepID=UPI0011C050D6|nr:hypothetical protein [Moraxella caprae]
MSLSNHNGFPPPLNKLGANGKPSFAGSLLYATFGTPANKPIITNQDTPDPFNGYETTAITALIDVVNCFWP